MVIFPNCKINLGLHVLRKRPDGFHDIDTVFYPAGLRDALEIIIAPDKRFEFTTSGLPVPGDPGDNLCIKAYGVLRKEYDLPPVKIHLHKVIPMGAGLGGGSADAACTLKLLDRLFDVGLSKEQLLGYAASLGSDCSFFIENIPARAGGRGEILMPLAVGLQGMTLVIVVPPVHVSTAEAYRMVTPVECRTSVSELVQRPPGEWKGSLVNDFERPVTAKYPVISAAIQTMYRTGAIYAAMSGSGSAVYGIFEQRPAIGDAFPGCITWIS